MVKEIEYLDTPFCGKDSSKIAKFTSDIRKIIENKIEYAELVDFPYADSTANQDLVYKAKQVLRSYCWKKYCRAPSNVDLFKFAKRTEGDKIHWYVWFNVSSWETMEHE